MNTTETSTATSFDLVISSSGLESEGQLAIRSAFNPFWVQAAEWAAKIETVTDPKVARASRLLLKNVRVEAEHKKDELKASLLQRTRAIDGAFQAIKSVICPLEEKLDAIEKAEQRRIEAAKAALKAERDAALRQYGIDTQWIQTGEMRDSQFLAMLDQARAAYLAKIEAERVAKEKAEAEAKAAAEAAAAKAKADAEERERQRLENERLRKEAEEREAAAKIEREKAAAEKAAIEAKAKAERDAAAAKLAQERKAREKLEREAAAARKAEADRIAAEQAAAARAAAAPDAAKLAAYAAALEAVELPQMATESGKRAMDDIARQIRTSIAAIKFTAGQIGGAA